MVVPTAAGAARDAFVGLGSNLGDRRGELARAFVELAEMPATTIVARSSLYESAPFEASGDDYLNAVAWLRTTLAPLDLLHELQAIEARHGRERPFARAPRTLDLDLLLFGDSVIDTAELVVPHPRLHERAFVLRPLAEIAPERMVPMRGVVQDLVKSVAGQRVAKLDR